jgi:hypothetical protein
VRAIWRSEAKVSPISPAIETSSIVSTTVSGTCVTIAIGVIMAASVSITISSFGITEIVEATTDILACKDVMGSWTRVPFTTAASSIPRHFDVLVDRVSRFD